MEQGASRLPRAKIALWRKASAYLSCRICWRLALAVFACIVVIETAILVPSIHSYEHDLLLRLEETSASALAAVIEVHGPATISAEFAAIGEGLTRATPIRGGVLLDASGAPVAMFGERPDLSVTATDHSAVRLGHVFNWERMRVQEGTRYDVRWPRQRTGLTGDVVMRLDAAWIGPELVAFVIRIALLVLMISVFVSGGAMIVLGRTILKPMLQVRDAVVAAGADPAHADTYAPDYRRNNEIGELVRSLNDLLERISRTHREELAMLTAMVDAASIAVAAFDEAGAPIYANATALQLFGCGSVGEMTDRRLPRLLPPERDGEALLIDELLADRDSYAGEAMVTTAGGASIPGFVNAGRLIDEQGRTVRYFATIADISQMRTAQEGLRKRNLELAAAEQAKSKFLANMSHEVRTPLNAIIGFSELLGDELTGETCSRRHRAFIEDIRKSGLHLLGIINDVLDMTKIESGTLDIKLSEVHVADVIDDALHMVAPQVEAHGLRVRVDFDQRTPSLCADELKLRQILLNLLTNAVKFTPEGGVIAVGVAVGDSAKLGACLEISVSDTGMGIAPGELASVLEPFSQGSTALQLHLGGAGLGLPLCKALAEAHGGELALASEVGRGTTVTIRLPIERPLESAA